MQPALPNLIVEESKDGERHLTNTLNTTQDSGYHSIRIHASVKPPMAGNVSPSKCKLPIFLPVGRFYLIWNIFLFAILIYSVIETPLVIAFVNSADISLTLIVISFAICLTTVAWNCNNWSFRTCNDLLNSSMSSIVSNVIVNGISLRSSITYY